MRNLKIKQKILLLTAVPLILTVIALMLVSIYQLRSLGEQEVNQIRTTMMASKRESLLNYIEITESSIRPILTSELDVEEMKREVYTAVRAISYGDEDGYIFGLNYDGVMTIHAAKPELEGRNVIELKDVNGTPLIADLIKAGRNGGGYVEYLWDKPSRGTEAPKLSYAVDIKPLGWVLGTGFYIDDIDDAVALKQAEVDAKIQATVVISSGVGVAILIVIVLINLWFSNRALVKPILELSESARQMSLGKLNTNISVDSKDEIGELADAIGRMQKSLKVIFKKLKQG